MRCSRSVTSTDVKTNYKRNAAALAQTRGTVAAQQHELDEQKQMIEELQARLARMNDLAMV
jgi:hypothetical protein